VSNDYDLAKNAKDPNVEFYAEGDKVFMSFHGDGLYLFEIKSNRKHTFAKQVAKILNTYHFNDDEN
jgi:hypothetical protein